jgi:predicted phage tail protein
LRDLMKVTVNFSKTLQKYTNCNEITIDVFSYRDILSACVNLLPLFKQHLFSSNLHSQLTLVDSDRYIRDFELDFKPRSENIYLIPTISGGVATGFDSLGNLNVFYGSSSPVSNQAIALRGIDKRIRDSVLFGKASTAFDVAQRKVNRENGVLENSEDPSKGFGSLATMDAAGKAIPLHFGMVRTSGVLISQYIKHIQRGGIDTVRVADYI